MPVFNVERTVRASLLSALEQTYEDIEYLIVDDCSPDSSFAVVEKIANEHPRGKNVRIIRHPINKGTGEARNTAVREATGEYIFFMDSDDLIDPDCIEKLVRYMEETPVDFVAASRVRQTADGKVLSEDVYEPAIVKDGDMAVARFRYVQNHRIFVEIWNKLYRLDFLRSAHVECLPNNRVEDVSFTYQAVMAARSCRLVPDKTYKYIIHDGQSLSPFMRDRARALNLSDCFCQIREKDLNVVQQYRKHKDYNAFLTGVFSVSYLHARILFASPMLTRKEKRNCLKKLLDNGLKHYDWLHMHSAKQFFLLALSYMPWWIRRIYFSNTVKYIGDYEEVE